MLNRRGGDAFSDDFYGDKVTLLASETRHVHGSGPSGHSALVSACRLTCSSQAACHRRSYWLVVQVKTLSDYRKWLRHQYSREATEKDLSKEAPPAQQ